MRGFFVSYYLLFFDMKIIKSGLFEKFPELSFGLNTKIGLDRTSPYFFNMSFTVGDKRESVKENRQTFYKTLQLAEKDVAYQKQIHSDIITYVENGGLAGESDALITDKFGVGLAVSTADCTPIFIYDPKQKIIAAVHSGWRGTEQKILLKTIQKLKSDYNCKPENIYSFIGPAISQKNYEVGTEVAEKFDEKYLDRKGEKFLLDLPGANLNMLLNSGIPTKQIENSGLCTFENRELHSYRRDGKKSGRALGIIAMRKQ
jgi:YfiH family protein